MMIKYADMEIIHSGGAHSYLAEAMFAPKMIKRKNLQKQWVKTESMSVF